MLALLAIAALLLLPGVWLFARMMPTTQRAAALRRFNRVSCLVAFLVAVSVVAYFWATTGRSIDHAWWPVLAALFSAIASGLALLIATVLRHISFRQAPRRSPQ